MTTGTGDSATALIVVDLQPATLQYQSAQDGPSVVANVARLAAVFRERGRPVVVVVAELNTPPDGRTTYSDRTRPVVADADLVPVPELGRRPGDIVISRRGWGVFTDTSLDGQLRAEGVTAVVVVGVATSFGVESTAREAYDLGYDVAVVSDAVNDPRVEAHRHSLANVVPALGLVVTTDEVVAGLG